jgi:membrane fusion protein (multidrug efflux system)
VENARGAGTQTPTRPANGPGTTVADDELEVEERARGARGGRRGLPGGLRLAAIAAGVIVALLILFYGIRFIAYMTTHQSTDDAYVEADNVTVTSKISEHVQAIYTDTNQYVHKGQLLIQLNDRDERDRYNQALAAYRAEQSNANAAQQNLQLTKQQVKAQTQQGRGGVASAQSDVTNAQEHVAQARSQLSSAQAAVPAAREALAKAQADYRRTSSLVSTGDLAKADLDAATAALQQARAQYQQALDNVGVAQASLNAAQSAVDVSQGQLTTAQGKLTENALPERVNVQQAQTTAANAQTKSLAAQLATARDQLSYTKIYAPIDGYIGQKSVDVGQQVAPGTPLLMIVPLAHVYVTANFKETQMSNIRPGEQADVSVDAYPGVKFSGTVASIGPASQNTFALVPAQNATGNFVKVTQRIPVRIYVNSASKPLDQVPLRPGMSVVAAVKVK